MNHPVVAQIERTGYPAGHQEPQIIGIDSRNEYIYAGDELYIYEEETFVIEELSHDAIEVLEMIGAERSIAK